MQPIRPEDIGKAKRGVIPDKVVGVFNRLIAKHYSNGSATIKQEEVVEMLTVHMECDRAKIYEEKWLDIEDLFRDAGWKVTYDKPGYNETYPATFTFRR